MAVTQSRRPTRGERAPPPSRSCTAGMRTGRHSATAHQLRIVAGGSGARGYPRPEEEEEAEEVGVRAAWGVRGRVPGPAPQRREVPAGAAPPCLCALSGGLSLALCGCGREAEGGRCPSPGAPPLPTPPVRPARPAPSAPRPPRRAAARPGRWLRCTRGLRAPGRGRRRGPLGLSSGILLLPGAGHQVTSSSLRLMELENTL